MNQKRAFLVSLLQLAAGLGWIGGTYAEPSWSPGSQILLQLLHYLPVMVLFLFSARFLTAQGEHQNWGRTGLILFALFVKVTTLAWIAIGVTHFLGLAGPHTFADWFPIGVTNAGSGLLLGLLITHRDQHFNQKRA
jgi:hypothetical protein